MLPIHSKRITSGTELNTCRRKPQNVGSDARAWELERIVSRRPISPLPEVFAGCNTNHWN